MGPRRWGRGRRDVRVARKAASDERFNGAATMGSRKTAAIATSPAVGRMLQWGRDDGVAEDGGRGSGDADRALQWGRDDGVAEDDGRAGSPWRDACASMGPRRWGRGRRCVPAASDGVRSAASMGPRRWGRGRRRRMARRRRGPRCFNGAATMGSRKTGPEISRPARGQLQWGRDDGVAEDVGSTGDGRRAQPSASMGPRRWGRGRPRVCGHRVSPWTGFNGAATMGSRKTPERCAGSPRRSSASMGPRRWGRGRRRGADVGRSSRRFNGAATMGSRKTSTSEDRHSRPRLQWGRDDGVAEDADRDR